METNFKLKLRENKEGEILEVDVQYPILVREINGHFLVKCPLFNTTGYSETSVDDAIQNHEDDLRVFFDVHITRHSLKQTLKLFGWERTLQNRYVPPTLPAHILSGTQSRSKKFSSLAA